MRARLAVVSGIVLITLLGFFSGVPGHTYLQSDTQIYIPMMERIWDPSVLGGDLVAAKPHLAFTIYDEVSIALRWLLRSDFETVLQLQQLLFRALQLLGIYLLARAFVLSRSMALGVAAIAGLGATIVGPAVLLMEYEPVPRGFAIGWAFLAIGLAATNRLTLASCAAAIGFLYHAPTVLPVWLCLMVLIFRRREWRALLPLGAAVLGILAAAKMQAGVVEQQQLFFRVDGEFERLQRLRASYNWVETWVGDRIRQYLDLWVASLIAYWRVRPRAGRVFALGLPVIGLLCVPLSYLLLEGWHWGMISQFQPARALLFVPAFALILCGAAGLKAAGNHAWVEASLWLTLVFIIPMQPVLRDLKTDQIALAAGLAVAMAVLPGVWRLAPALAAFLLLPAVGHVRNYPKLETAELVKLEDFARRNTPRDSIWVFPDARQALYPGIFRARTLRPVYVDWKAGGQVNYYRSLAYEWWSRWTDLNGLRYDAGEIGKLRALGIDYMALRMDAEAAGLTPVFKDEEFWVYRLR